MAISPLPQVQTAAQMQTERSTPSPFPICHEQKDSLIPPPGDLTTETRTLHPASADVLWSRISCSRVDRGRGQGLDFGRNMHMGTAAAQRRRGWGNVIDSCKKSELPHNLELFGIGHGGFRIGIRDSFLRSSDQWCQTPFLQLAKYGMANNTCCKAQRMGASVASHIRLSFLHAGVGRGW